MCSQVRVIEELDNIRDALRIFIVSVMVVGSPLVALQADCLFGTIWSSPYHHLTHYERRGHRNQSTLHCSTGRPGGCESRTSGLAWSESSSLNSTCLSPSSFIYTERPLELLYGSAPHVPLRESGSLFEKLGRIDSIAGTISRYAMLSTRGRKLEIISPMITTRKRREDLSSFDSIRGQV